MIGDSWRTVRIKEIGQVITGRTPSEHHPEHFGSHLPFVTPSDMDGSRYIDNPQRWLSEEGATALAKSIVPQGVAVSCIGWQLGKAAILRQPSVTNQQINTIVPMTNSVDMLFLYYALIPRRQEIFQLASGGSRTPIMNKSSFEDLPLILPPLPEQQAIGSILGAFDDKIELNQQINSTLEETARTIFRSWLVCLDPVHAKSEGRHLPGLAPELAAVFPSSFQETELGLVPDGWQVKSLDVIANFLNGLALQKFPPVDENWLPVIKIAEMRHGVTSSSDRASAYIDKRYIVNDGDILFSWSGSLEVRMWSGGPGALNQHLFKVTSDEYPKWFYYYWLLAHLSEFQSIASDKATTMGHIQRHHLSSATVLTPPPDTLEAITEIMAPLLDSVLHNNQQSRTLAQLRDTLLPALISGKARLKDAERLAQDTL